MTPHGTGATEALFLHCSLGRGRAWAGVLRQFAGLSGHMPDLLGHGDAPDPDPARDLHDATTEAVRVPPGPVAVIGHSFGATIALRLAIERQAEVTALVLYEPVLFAAAGDGPGRRLTAERLGDVAGLVAAGRRAAALDAFLAVWGASGGAEALPPELRAYMEARIHLIPAAAPALDADRARLLPRLAEVTCPVVLIEGAASPPVIPEIMATLAAGLPEARRIRIPGAGHMGPVTHPRAVAEAMAPVIGADLIPVR